LGLLDRIRRHGAPTTPREADRLALQQLARRGADLAQPRHVVHFLYFAAEEDARSAADAVAEAGWSTSVEPPGDAAADWTVRADGHRVVGDGTVEAFRAWFEQVAEEHAGEYDGWEAAAKP
jgi:hypothetical protein